LSTHGPLPHPLAVSGPEPKNRGLTGRAVKNMNAAIPNGSFFVYFFLVRDHIRCDRDGKCLDGSNQAGMLFEHLPEAESYARSVADVDPRIGAGVYDSSWKVVAQFFHQDFLESQKKANSPSRLFVWATGLLALGGLFLWLEMRSGWTLIFGFLIGARFLLAGLFRAGRAFAALYQRRERNVD
jgi:hypothetical protein